MIAHGRWGRYPDRARACQHVDALFGDRPAKRQLLEGNLREQLTKSERVDDRAGEAVITEPRGFFQHADLDIPYCLT